MKRIVICLPALVSLMLLASCMGPQKSNAIGGELTGVGGAAINEPAPYGMVLVERGSIKLGDEEQDSLWGTSSSVKDVSVDAFWMDETEVTNSEYRQFV